MNKVMMLLKRMVKAGSANKRPTGRDYPLVIYLEGDLVEDLIAPLEGGIARLAESRTTTSSERMTDKSSDIGIRYSVLGMSNKGDRFSKEGATKSEITTKEISPTILFVRLHQLLKKDDIVQEISPETDTQTIKCNSFVECRVTLRPNPVMEKFDQLKSGVDLIKTIQNLSSSAKIMEHQKLELLSEIGDKAEAITNLFEVSFITNNTCDWVDKKGDTNVIFTTNNSCFLRPLDQILGGDFYVFGKIIRVISNEDDGQINLLRNTSIGKFSNLIPDANLQGILTMDDTGEKINTEITGPAVQILPIAIFA